MKKTEKAILRRKAIRIAKKVLGIHQNQTLSLNTYYKNMRLRLGKHIWKRKIYPNDIIKSMQAMGMKKGSNVFIHCNWNEFYNYVGTERDLIDAILSAIGEEGTLIMPAYPLLRKGKIFDVKKTVTAAGLLAEEFRKYPNVKRSINEQHSVCALGPLSTYLLNEHHLSETCWDEKSPYYKLSQINALVFGLGLGKYYMGTMIHCVESILRKNVKYFSDFYDENKTVHKYVDYDNDVKTYSCYDLKTGLVRKNKVFGAKHICMKYFDKSAYGSTQLSNLQICVFKAQYVIPRMIELGKKGIVYYRKPRPAKYKFIE